MPNNEMKYTNLEPGIYYRVTRGNSHIITDTLVKMSTIDGSISTLGGDKYPKSQLEVVCEGVLFAIDRKYYNNRRRSLMVELYAIDKILALK